MRVAELPLFLIAWKVTLEPPAGSICTMKQNHHFMVPDGDFKLLQGKDKLTLYQVRKAAIAQTLVALLHDQLLVTASSTALQSLGARARAAFSA